MSNFDNLSNKKTAWFDLKSSLRKRLSLAVNPDIEKSLISTKDFAHTFNQIISTYNQNDTLKYMSFEQSLMLAKFLLENEQRTETVQFVDNLIYTKNLKIKDEYRVIIFLLLLLFIIIEIKRNIFLLQRYDDTLR